MLRCLWAHRRDDWPITERIQNIRNAFWWNFEICEKLHSGFIAFDKSRCLALASQSFGYIIVWFPTFYDLFLINVKECKLYQQLFMFINNFRGGTRACSYRASRARAKRRPPSLSWSTSLLTRHKCTGNTLTGKKDIAPYLSRHGSRSTQVLRDIVPVCWLSAINIVILILQGKKRADPVKLHSRNVRQRQNYAQRQLLTVREIHGYPFWLQRRSGGRTHQQLSSGEEQGG